VAACVDVAGDLDDGRGGAPGGRVGLRDRAEVGADGGGGRGGELGDLDDEAGRRQRLQAEDRRADGFLSGGERERFRDEGGRPGRDELEPVRRGRAHVALLTGGLEASAGGGRVEQLRPAAERCCAEAVEERW